jgi:nucleoside-diphosphate-sugar epimerase
MGRVLVTGASGFVGLATCEALVAEGHSVIGYDRARPPFDADWMDRVTFVEGDIRDADALKRAFSDHDVTHAVHGAAVTPDALRERTSPGDILEINVIGSCRLMEAAAGHELRRILYLSSISAYGDAAPAANGRFDEVETAMRPSALYGISKLSAELAMRRLAVLNQQDLRILRLGPLFGPWERASGTRDVLSPHHQIARAARTGAPCVLPREVPADWLYAPDAARRIAGVLSCPDLDGDVFNLGGGEISTLVDWCRALQDLIPGFAWSVDSERSTLRTNYATDRPALDNARLDAACPGHRTPILRAARETLTWLDAFEPI